MTKVALNLPGFCDGLDVSRIQRLVNPQAVYDAGFRFVFVKGSEGVQYIDPKALEFLREFASVGLLTGVYGYARVAQGDPKAQARRAYDSAGTRHVVLPTLDLESAPPEWSARQLCDFAGEWLEEAEAQGATPGLYSYTSFLYRMDCKELRELLKRYWLWIAQYKSTTFAWAPSSVADMLKAFSWAFWQYSGDRGYQINGIEGDVDRNLFCGDEEQLRAMFGMAPAVPETQRSGILHGKAIVEHALEERAREFTDK